MPRSFSLYFLVIAVQVLTACVKPPLLGSEQIAPNLATEIKPSIATQISTLPTATYSLFSPTTTIIPTGTPAPVVFTGVVFLDANGSGQLDPAVFQCPTNATQSRALEYYFGPVCAGKAEQVITVMEPVLPKITICYVTTCSTTGTNGRFLIETPSSVNERIRIVEPNATDNALALRFVNIRIRKTSEKVNENIYTNSLYPISSSFELSILQDNDIGLMQGPLTSPFRLGNNGILIWNGFDIAGLQPWTKDGEQANYLGFTNNGWPQPPCKTGVNDSHSAVDFCLPINTPVLAMAPSQFTKTNIENGVNLEYFLITLGLNIQLGHLKENSFSYISQTQFLRGQQIALSGDTGDVDSVFGVIAQLHVMVFDTQGRPVDPFRNISDLTSGLGSKYSLWSVDNLIVDPIPGQLP
jgi:hypothetical protein